MFEGDKHKDTEEKKLSEGRVSMALRQLNQTLIRNMEDLSVVLNGYELQHTDQEMEEWNEYGALVAGYFGIHEVIKKINKAINRERK